MHDFIDICEKAARAAGQLLLSMQGEIHAQEKAPKDLVTEADLAAEQAIQEIVLGAFPDHGFLGEERDAIDAGAGSYRWIVDPLDGTTNYVHRLQQFAVSVALERGGEMLVGVVFDPVSDECFTAAAGQGAYVNGQRLAVSPCTELSQALVAASLSARVTRQSEEVRQLVDVLVSCQALRRLGSAALNLCYLAAGRLDGYWGNNLKPWDVAAGVLLVREAGGIVTGVKGGPFDVNRPKLAAAATPALHRQLVATIQGREPPGEGPRDT